MSLGNRGSQQRQRRRHAPTLPPPQAPPARPPPRLPKLAPRTDRLAPLQMSRSPALRPTPRQVRFRLRPPFPAYSSSSPRSLKRTPTRLARSTLPSTPASALSSRPPLPPFPPTNHSFSAFSSPTTSRALA